MTPSFSTPLLLLLPFLFVFLVSSVNSASDNIAASTARRLLHQPFYPIQWTPSPPAGDPSSLFFPSVPAATATPNPGTNATVATYFSSSRPGSGKNPVVVVAVAAASVAFLALLILSGFLLYRRHRSARDLMDSRKPFAGGDDANGGRAVASADFLYPGAVELSSDPWRPRTEDAVGSSPCWKLGTETLLEMDHQPNPELQPLPRLTRPLSGRVVPQPPPQRSSSVISRASSDDDPTFYPPKRSVASVTNESPSNPVPSMSSETKESFPAAAMATGTAPTQQPPPRHPRSRRTFPRMQLADCQNSTRRQPPRPPATLPTPLPLAPTAYTFSRMRPPAPPLPQATLDAAWRREQPMNVSTEPAPLGPTSRHGMLKPLLPPGVCGSVEDAGEKANDDMNMDNRVLDPKKPQILVKPLYVTEEEVSEALLDGNPEYLGTELLKL